MGTDTWETDRIIGKVAYQTPDVSLSGAFRARIRLGPFLAPSHAAGSLTLAGQEGGAEALLRARAGRGQRVG